MRLSYQTNDTQRPSFRPLVPDPPLFNGFVAFCFRAFYITGMWMRITQMSPWKEGAEDGRAFTTRAGKVRALLGPSMSLALAGLRLLLDHSCIRLRSQHHLHSTDLADRLSC